MHLNAAELEQAVFLTLKKQMEAAAPLAPDGTLRADSSVPERTEYEQQIETLQDGKRTLYERYLMGEIDLNTYKAEKTACDELLLKTKKRLCRSIGTGEAETGRTGTAGQPQGSVQGDFRCGHADHRAGRAADRPGAGISR